MHLSPHWTKWRQRANSCDWWTDREVNKLRLVGAITRHVHIQQTLESGLPLRLARRESEFKNLNILGAICGSALVLAWQICLKSGCATPEHSRYVARVCTRDRLLGSRLLFSVAGEFDTEILKRTTEHGSSSSRIDKNVASMCCRMYVH
ncbi:hypothetical protein BaRGS_00040377 [Batillaria attramentaria]|uniref:Uncharacterized protein n=1 Tax=Batillaria attramentaria TaxID=370345 RepID=A0ABD0J166_9CAEN